MGKMKIHELAKSLNLTSKEVIERANELGIEVKSHLSSIEDEEVTKIEKSYKKKSDDSRKVKETSKKEKTQGSTPVIIRREVIISDEEIKKREDEEKRKKQNQRDNNIGVVARKQNADYNIVYRNKPSKPMTVNELFGIKSNKKEEIEKKETKKVEDIKEEKIVKEETIKNDANTYNKTRNWQNNNNQNRYNNNRNNDQQGQRQQGGFNNNNQNRYNNNRNNDQQGQRQQGGFNNNNQNRFGNNRNNDQQGQRQQGGFNNNNQNRFNNNRNNYQNGGQNGYNRPNRPLDERGIEKNIKNIMSADVIEKDSVREYNRTVDKKKNSKFEDNKAKKTSKNRNTDRFDEDKLKSLKQEDKLSNMFHDSEGGMLDYYDLTTVRGKRNKKKNGREGEERVKQKIFRLTEIVIPESISVKDLATELKKTSSEVIKKLFGYGIMATINNDLDFDTAFLVAGEFGVTAVKKETVKEEDVLFDDTEDTEEELIARPPVVVVMGHVDHGKTSLLDAIRSTNVIEGEAGGITQHIGAYKVKINDREITFLDTPGHEAFTSMRARGAQITDIAILIVAANDGVMPQTVEAINHAKAAGIPIVVAINKIDLPGANPDKIKQDLMQYELVPEEWGGDTIFVEISAKQKTNIDQLLEMVLLVADMKELKTNPKKQAKGVVIEARLDKAKGPIATMLVQRGTLDVGDTIVVGSSIGRIRAMANDKGQKVKKAGPSTPVSIMGLTEVPEAGDTFYEVKDEKMAKHLIERRKRQAREKAIGVSTAVTLDDLFSQIEKGNLKQLNLIVKADVQGSVEAVKQSLEKLSNEEVKVKVIHSSVGAVTETDVTLAKVSKAIVIAFNVRPNVMAKEMAEKEEIQIKQYSIIYKAIEDVEDAMNGMLDPKFEEKVIGNAEIRQTFKISNVGTIAGCYVLDGKIERNAGVRIIRENVVIHEGKLKSLKRLKDDVKEVAKGYECGVQIEDYNDLKEMDVIEVFIMEEIKR